MFSDGWDGEIPGLLAIPSSIQNEGPHEGDVK